MELHISTVAHYSSQVGEKNIFTYYLHFVLL